MTHEEGRIWYWPQQDGTREYTGYCYCDECKETSDPDYQPEFSIAEKEAPATATYAYNGQTRNADDTAKAINDEWGSSLGCELQVIQEAVYTLRPGDYFMPDEPWANQAKCVRIS